MSSSFLDKLTPVKLRFSEDHYCNVFALKKSTTLAQTLEHRRYSSLVLETEARYSRNLQQPIGSFLIELKSKGDLFYQRFLNPYGDLNYCAFKIVDTWAFESRGIYAFLVENELKYIGRCRNSLRTRINQGYGRVSPKNCYLDGQATNCNINSMICPVKEKVTLGVYPMSDIVAIEEMEKILLKELNLPWNIQR